MVVPFDQMLHRIGKRLSKPQSIVVVGDIYPKAGQMIQSWNRTQKNISHVTTLGDQGAYLTPWEHSEWENVE